MFYRCIELSWSTFWELPLTVSVMLWSYHSKLCVCFFSQIVSPLEEWIVMRTPRSKRPVRDQMFTGVLVTEKYAQMFTGEHQLCNEGGIIIDGELFYVNIISQMSPRGSPIWSWGFHLRGILCRGDLLDWLCSNSFAWKITGVEFTGVCEGPVAANYHGKRQV